MSEVSWRAARASDAAGLAELFQALARTAPTGLETDSAEVASRLSRPGLNLELDTLVGVDTAGAVLAYAETADMGVGQGQFRIRLTNAVHPDLGSDALHKRTTGSLSGPGTCTRSSAPTFPACSVPGVPRPTIPGWNFSLSRDSRWPAGTRTSSAPWTSPFLERGSCPASRWCPTTPTTTKPPGSRTTTPTPTAPSALLPEPQAWPQHAVGLPNFLPDASFLALAESADGPDIAAFLFSLEHRDTAGIREGSLHCLGTRKPWRRRGLATILIGHALAAYRNAGYAHARLEVNSSNTDAVRLYAHLDFTDSGRGYAMLHAPIR